MSQKYHDLDIQKISLKIGPYKITSLSTTSFGLDGGAMFGTVPKVLWSKTNPSDDQNRITMDCRCLLLESDDHKILIDTGLGGDFVEKYGPKLGPKFSKMYSIPAGEKSGIEKALEKLNLQTSDITNVILTHLHFDHTGGSTKVRDGKLTPTFENAEYFIQKDNLETALNPNLREKASYYKCNFEILAEKGMLTLLEGNQEILPNISFSISNGHTKGQQNVWVEDDENSLLYCADLIPTATHIRLPWVMGYDLNPLLLIEEKKTELQKALNKNSFLFFEHDPYCSAAQIKASENGSDFRLKELFELS
ncbi:MAG: MBL fold metallo-hydrolase [Bdellovibrionales bacterium]